MMLNELIAKFDNNLSFEKLIDSDWAQYHVDSEIVVFFEKYNGGQEILASQFDNFTKKVAAIPDKKITKELINLLQKINTRIFKAHEHSINEIINRIEICVKEGRSIEKITLPKEMYFGLLNIHILFSFYLRETKRICYYYNELARTTIPFAINVMHLTGIFDDGFVYHDLYPHKPLYPQDLRIMKKEKILLTSGIKNSEKYYPIKRIFKLYEGDTGNTTFLATNGKKLLFVRGGNGQGTYSPNAILASKIATLVSKKHFSCERLLDNHLVASRKITSYVLSVADDATKEERKKYIDQDKQIFPGSGIIDEVCNFVKEGDSNLENFGFSSENVRESHLAKIDFDQCDLTSKMAAKYYEQNILTAPLTGIYHAAEHVQSAPEYIQEKLFTRLKLAMLCKPIICGLADKAFICNNMKEKAIAEIIRRSDIALKLFVKHNRAKIFMQENSDLFVTCHQEIIDYVNSHWKKEEDSKAIINSLNLRVKDIEETINKALGIKINRTAPLEISEKNVPKNDTLVVANTVVKTDIAVQTNMHNGIDIPVEINTIRKSEGLAKAQACKSLTILQSQIEIMHSYGKKLLTIKPSDQARALAAIELAQKLKIQTAHFYSLPQEERIENFDNFKQQFSQLLHSQDKLMQMHRKRWKPITANIFIALTGVGAGALLANIAIHAVNHMTNKKKFAFNNTLFFAKTNLQQKIEEIEKAINQPRAEMIN